MEISSFKEVGLLCVSSSRTSAHIKLKWKIYKFLSFGFSRFSGRALTEIEFVTLTKNRLITNHIQFWLFSFHAKLQDDDKEPEIEWEATNETR